MKRFMSVLVLVLSLVVAGGTPAGAAGGLRVTGLTVEHRADPLGVDVARPLLGWIVAAPGRQIAYRIEISTGRNGPADVWDSGRVASARSVDIEYGGPALASRTRYFWRVKVWAGGASQAWSRWAWFETAFLKPAEFRGDWIGAHRAAPALDLAGASWIWHPDGDPADSVPPGTRYFRRTVDLPSAAGELQITADDAFTVYVNGTEMARSPAVADSWRTAAIVDLSPALRAGTNVIAVAATNANPGPAGLLARLHTGGTTVLVTDGSWRTAATAEPGWQQPGFDDAAWTTARVAAPYGSGPWGGSVSAPPPPETLLRKEFRLGKPVAAARAYIAGLGYNKLYLNGSRIGDHELDPGFTVYDKTVLYSTYDVTAALRGGANAVGVSLGRGFHSMTNPDEWKASAWWREPRLKFELEVTFTDGTRKRVVSDAGWLVAEGPTRSESLWFGETYDARLEQPGWDRPGFGNEGWRPAVLVDAPGGTLRSQAFPAIKQTGELPVTRISGSVYDVGTPTAGWARIGVRGPRGATVRITYGEKLRDDGSVDNIGAFGMQLQSYSYTLRGDGPEFYQPSYSYAGFRYVQVDLPAGVTLESIGAVRVHTAVTATGDFTSSSDLLNRYHAAQADTILNNLHSIPTDTPMYEKRPYTADGHLYADSAIANFDMRHFYASWMRTHRDDQSPDGSLGVTEPVTESGRAVKDPIWSASLVLVTWDLWWYYGDRRAVAENYPAMTAWLRHFERTIEGTGHIYTGFSYGDWLAPGHAFPPEGTRLSGTAYLYDAATKLATMARELGRDGDARHFETLAARIAAAFNAAFLDRPAGAYFDNRDAGYRQTANLLPLSLGLVPADARPAVIATLVADIERRGGHLDTGALGTKVLLPVLTDAGHGDLAYRVATNPTYPGWGYWFEALGATTMWEEWGATSRSRDHAFLGTVDDWLYQRVAGIEPAAPGYAAITVRPSPVGDLRHASAHVDSPRGKISSNWTRTGKRFVLRVVVPAGATATVHVPAERRLDVTRPPGATFTGMSGGHAVFTVPPGRHTFVSDRIP